jgi:hypothetical protein
MLYIFRTDIMTLTFQATKLPLAEYLISETASQDPKVGGPVRIAKVCPVKGYKALTDDEVFMLRKRNQELNNKLREFFRNGG